MKSLSRVVALLPFFLFPLSIQAANSFGVVINEIAWMGTKESFNNEWIELYNHTNEIIDLEEWILKATDESPKISLKGTILAKSFYLLERTDDDTVPNINADLIYKGSLSNKGEHLKLINSQGETVDEADCSSGWFAGNNSTKQTMEKKDAQPSRNSSENWESSQNAEGSPRAENILTIQKETEGQKIKGKSEIYPSGIIINEILPSPRGPDAENEWIEVFNQNNFKVDLSFWKVADTVGKSNIYTFPEGIIISSKGFLILHISATKITLNNDGDGLKLFQPDGNIIDTVNYKKAPQGQSYSLAKSGWEWSTVLTPDSVNIISGQTGGAEEAASKKEAKEYPKKKSAATGEQVPESSNSVSILLIALALAVFSGAIILILKKALIRFPKT